MIIVKSYLQISPSKKKSSFYIDDRAIEIYLLLVLIIYLQRN